MPWDNINSPFFLWSHSQFQVRIEIKSFCLPKAYPLDVLLRMDINLIISCCVKSTFFYFKPFHVRWEWANEILRNHVTCTFWCSNLSRTLMFYRTCHPTSSISVPLSAERKLITPWIYATKSVFYCTWTTPVSLQQKWEFRLFLWLPLFYDFGKSTNHDKHSTRPHQYCKNNTKFWLILRFFILYRGLLKTYITWLFLSIGDCEHLIWGFCTWENMGNEEIWGTLKIGYFSWKWPIFIKINSLQLLCNNMII